MIVMNFGMFAYLLVWLVIHIPARALDVPAEGAELRAHEDARSRAHRHLRARDNEPGSACRVGCRHVALVRNSLNNASVREYQ